MKCMFQTHVFLRTTSIKVKWNVYKILDSWDPDWTRWIRLYSWSLKTHISQNSPDASYAWSPLGFGIYGHKEMRNMTEGAEVPMLAKEPASHGTKNESQRPQSKEAYKEQNWHAPGHQTSWHIIWPGNEISQLAAAHSSVPHATVPRK